MTYHITPENVSVATRAEARRWLDRHIGRSIDTVQVQASGRTWTPGERVLSRTSGVAWALDGSEVRLTTTHRIAGLSDTSLSLAWYDEDGVLIHTTTYTAVTA